MVLDTGFGLNTHKSISNPYPFKKIGFYPYPYPLSSQRIFLLFDWIESGRKSTDMDTFAISTRVNVNFAQKFSFQLNGSVCNKPLGLNGLSIGANRSVLYGLPIGLLI